MTMPKSIIIIIFIFIIIVMFLKKNKKTIRFGTEKVESLGRLM